MPHSSEQSGSWPARTGRAVQRANWSTAPDDRLLATPGRPSIVHAKPGRPGILYSRRLWLSALPARKEPRDHRPSQAAGQLLLDWKAAAAPPAGIISLRPFGLKLVRSSSCAASPGSGRVRAPLPDRLPVTTSYYYFRSLELPTSSPPMVSLNSQL